MTARPTLPQNALHHLGALLRGACNPGDTDHFTALLAQLDATMMDAAGAVDAAFRTELLAYVPALRRYAHSLTRDPTASDDVVQDTLLRAWRSRERFAVGTNFEGWLFTILRNQFYGTFRRQGREVPDIEGVHAARLTTAPEQNGHVDLQDVQAALDCLTPAMREAVMLVAVEGFTYEAAAAIMNCQIGTMKSRVWRARQQLSETLGYTGIEVGQDAITLSAMGTSV